MNQRIAHKICKSISITDTIGHFDDNGVYIITGLKPHIPYSLLQFKKAYRKEVKFFQRPIKEYGRYLDFLCK